jgi:hypothetical protein
MENDNKPNDMQSPGELQPELHNIDKPARKTLAEQSALKLFFVPLAAGVFWALTPWFSQSCYQRFFDAWAMDPFSDSAKTVSLLIAILYTLCVVSMMLPCLCQKFPHFLVSGSIFLSMMAASIVYGLWDLSGVNMDSNLQGVLLGAGFLGIFIGGPLAIFLRFDEDASSVIAVAVIFGVVGMVVASWLLYDLSQWLGVGLGGIVTLAIGGVAGFLLGAWLSSWLLGSPRGDRIFKYLVCITCAGAAARVVALAIAQMM